MASRRSDAGGRGGAGGFNYQHRVSAWSAAQILAGPGAAPVTALWTSHLVRLDCETGEPVDDVKLRPAVGPPVCLQAKRTLSLGAGPTSDLAGVATQFVRHHLDEGRREDRLALVVGPGSSGRIREDLRRFLDAVRSAPPDVPIGDLTLPQHVHEAGRVWRAHVETAWLEEVGADAGPEELRRFLSVVWVWPLDVEPDGPDERAARELLRSQVVLNPNDGDVAWVTLLEASAREASRAGGADRQALRQTLRSVGTPLRGGVEYDADIDRLRQLSEGNLANLDAFAALPFPSAPYYLDREVLGALAPLAGETSLLVTGEPGAGKTVAVHGLARQLVAEGIPVVFLPVGSLSATSLGALRQELGLSHDLVEVIAEGPPGVLIIDALDAARTEAQAKMARHLILAVSRSCPDWKVVASVRRWDLLHDRELQALFPVSTAYPASLDQADPLFAQVQHLNVPLLSDDELSELSGRAPSLAQILLVGGDDARELLSNFFNLRLACELLAAGVNPSELGALRTQIQLLDRYWDARVGSGRGWMGRTEIARRGCEAMLAARDMKFPRAAVLANDAAAENALEELLGRQVLVEVLSLAGLPPPLLRFAHHVLSDYAVAVVLVADLMNRVRADPDLVVFARPSLDILANKLWDADRGQFWELSLSLSADSALPRLVSIPFAEVAARRARVAEDLGGLVDPLWSQETREPAVGLLAHIGAALNVIRQGDPGASRQPWAALTERLAERPEMAEGPLRAILDDLVRFGPPLEGLDLQQCGYAARALLEYQWQTASPQDPTVRLPLEATVATVGSDPVATETLLRRAIEPAQLSERGFQDLPWIADGVPTLVPLLPAFVEDLYVAVLSHDEQSADQTALGTGRILALTSTRRQDFEMAQWRLVQFFPAFLQEAPRHALRTVERLAEIKHAATRSLDVQVAGRDVHVLLDNSHHWDSRTFARGKDLQDLLAFLEVHVTALAQDQPAAVRTFLDLVIDECRHAAIWRRVLAAAAHLPEAFGDTLDALWTDRSIFSADEFESPAAAGLAARHGVVLPADRGPFEAVVLEFRPQDTNDGSTDWRLKNYSYEELVARLDLDAIVDSELRAARERSAGQDSASASDPWVGPRPEREDIPSSEDGQRLWVEVQRLEAFTDTYLNDPPTPDAVTEVRASVEAVDAAICGGIADLVDLVGDRRSRQAGYALAEACERWTRVAAAIPEPDRMLARRVLLRASGDPAPTSRPDDGGSVKWGPRTAAARGLVQLLRGTDEDKEVMEALEQLVADEVAFVRAQVLNYLPGAYRRHRDWSRRLVLKRADNDPDDFVQRTVASLASAIGGIDRETAVELLRRLAPRLVPSEETDSAFEACAEVAGLLWVWTGEIEFKDVLDGLLYPQQDCTQPTCALMHEVRASGAFLVPDAAVRQRAFSLVESLAREPLGRLQDFPSGDVSDEVTIERWKRATKVLDAVAKQVLFASGATQDRRQGGGVGPTAEQRRFWDEARPVVGFLAKAPVPSVTHDLVKTIEFFVDADPRSALLTVHGAVTQGGRVGYYQFESLAVEAVVRVVERYLAAHRGTLQDPQCLSALRETLDAFVAAGWPKAQALAVRLGDIFR